MYNSTKFHLRGERRALSKRQCWIQSLLKFSFSNFSNFRLQQSIDNLRLFANNNTTSRLPISAFCTPIFLTFPKWFTAHIKSLSASSRRVQAHRQNHGASCWPLFPFPTKNFHARAFWSPPLKKCIQNFYNISIPSPLGLGRLFDRGGQRELAIRRWIRTRSLPDDPANAHALRNNPPNR